MAGVPKVLLYLPSKGHVLREALRARLSEFVGNPNRCGDGVGGGRFTDPEHSTCEGGDLGDELFMDDDSSSSSEDSAPAPAASAPAGGGGVQVGSGVAGVPQPPFDASQFNSKGKPNPGSDAWKHAHGISDAVFEDRGYIRFEQGQDFGDLPDEIQALYDSEPEARRQLNKVLAQSGGYIMVRNAVPGVDEPGIVPQTRPDVKVVLDQGKERYRHSMYQSAIRRAEAARAMGEMEASEGAAAVVAVQQGRVDRARARLAEAAVITKESFVAPAAERVAAAQTALTEAKEAGDEEAIVEAKKGLTGAKKSLKAVEKQAEHDFGASGERTEEYREVMAANATKEIRNAEKKLARYVADPVAAIANEIEMTEGFEDKARQAWEDVAIKYVFPPNPKRLEAEIASGAVLGKAGRVNIHGEENIRRLMEGRGRVYLAMEGNMKEDSVLTAIADEMEPDAVAISVPSVTLWRNKEMMQVAQRHLRGREVVLIPDADGVNNARVRNEARALQSMLESAGARVVVAPPPIPLDKKGRPVRDPEHPSKVLQFEQEIPGSPSGVREQLKGVDDYLGLGKGTEAKGTLGNLAVQNRTVPAVDLSGVVDALAVSNAESALRAISNIAGPSGSARIGQKMISAAMGKFYNASTTARRSIEQLEKVGLVRREYVFDPVELARGRRTMHPDMTEERINELVKARVIERPAFGDDDTRPIEYGYEETAIITIVDPQYRAVDSPTTPLYSLPTSRKGISTTRIKSLAGSGKSLQEIADILGIATSTVSRHLSS